MTAITLCTPEDAARLLPLVARMHEEMGLATDADHQAAALTPLLEGSPLGAAWIFGPARAPVGYIIVTFGWSVELGGMEAFVDELYVRPSVRRRGIASEVLHEIGKALREAGVVALHLEVDGADEGAQALYARSGFRARDRYVLMTRVL